MAFKLIKHYNKKSGGVAIINKKVHHHKNGRWIQCADCNRNKKVFYGKKWHKQ